MFTLGDYRIRFWHRNPIGKEQRLGQKTTQCFIRAGDSEIATGIAVCSKQDQFIKAVGRKLSLTRALQIAAFDKTTRTKFWKYYFESLEQERTMQ